MLRKTGNQRNSMKRTPVYDSYGGGGSSGFHSESNVVYRSNAGGARNRSPSPEWSPNEMIRMSEKYGRQDSWGGARQNNANNGESVTAELAPGIVVEGYVADL